MLKVSVTGITVTSQMIKLLSEIIEDKRIPSKVRAEYIEKCKGIFPQ